MMNYPYEEDKLLTELIGKIREQVNSGKYQTAKDLAEIYQNIKVEKVLEKVNGYQKIDTIICSEIPEN